MFNPSIAKRLTLSFGTMLGLLLLVVAASSVGTRSSQATSNDSAGRRIGILHDANAMLVCVLQAARHTRNMRILDPARILAEMAGVRQATRRSAAAHGTAPRATPDKGGGRVPDRRRGPRLMQDVGGGRGGGAA